MEIDGIAYAIDPNFRVVIRSLMAFEDADLTAAEKTAILYSNLYLDYPEDFEKAMLKAVWFLNGGKENGELASQGYRLFSWEKDANLIFAAFQQTHGIDLQETEFLHWWKFLALFFDLGSETVFCNLIGLRKRVKSGKASKEERQMARDMGEAFDIPEIDDRTLEEREKERIFLESVEMQRRNR